MAEPVKTPIATGVIDRVVRGVKYVVSGAEPSDWFSPSQPLPPFAQEQAEGRQFDYQTGYNLQQRPKVYEGVTFAELRALADGLDILRLVIETRKDMLCKMTFLIKPVDEGKEQDARCEEIQNFLRFPDKEHSWEEWLRMVLEDLFVCDAPTLYPRYTYGNTLYALEPMDGATIKRVIDGQGRTPVPPEVAYQQILKGVPAVDYSRDELIYKPRNLRTNKVYGYSPVEQILLTVNTALRRQVSQLQYYTDGDAVDRILSVPAEWNPDQVAQFREWWASMLAGNTGARRQTMFVPNGVTSVNTKEELLKDSYDEWLARVICYAFSIAPSAFISDVNRATATTNKLTAEEEGLQPVMQWIKSLIDYIIVKYFGYDDLCMQWEDEASPDPMMQAQINQIYINAGIKTANEVREELGLDALEEPETPPPLLGTQTLPNKTSDTNPVESKTASPPAVDNPLSEKMEKALKKPVRGITPLNRERRAVRRNLNGLRRVTKAALRKKAEQYALAIEGRRMAMGKAVDESKETVDKLLATITVNWDDFAEDVEPYLRAMALDGVKAAAVQIQLENIAGADVNLANERAEQYAQDRAAEMVGKKWVDGQLVENPNPQWALADSEAASDATRDYLRGDITQAIEEGWSNQQLADKLVENYAFSPARAETIARTEIGNADIQGNMEAYQEAIDSGIEVKKRWITGADECDDCAANADQGAIDFDELFQSGDDAPLAHPNCRCDILPVLAGEDDSEKFEKYSDDQERDEQGRWTDGGGGEGNQAQALLGWNHGVSQALTDHVSNLGKEVAQNQGFNPNRISVSDENRTVEIEGKVFQVTGATNPNGGVQLYPASMVETKAWRIYDERQKDNRVKEVIAHEIGHAMFDDVAKEYLANRFDPANKVAQSINHLHETRGLFDRLEDADGITPYSTTMWDLYHEGVVTKAEALHETFAEINAISYLNSGGGKAQLSRDNLKSIGVKPVWQTYYRTYMNAYKQLQATHKFAKYSDDQERDEQGRWTDGGGGESSNTQSTRQIGWNRMDSAHVQSLANEVADSHYYDSNQIVLSNAIEKSTIGEKDYFVSGRSYPDGHIDVYAMTAYDRHGSLTDEEMDKRIRGTVAHEIGHQIQSRVEQQYALEKAAIERNPEAHADIAGRYPDSFNKDYPVFQVINNMHASTSPYMTYQLEAADGITKYSAAMWSGYYENKNSGGTAIRETFAEINKLAYLQSGGGKSQITLANLKAAGVKPAWQKYYRAYMSAWKGMQTNGK